MNIYSICSKGLGVLTAGLVIYDAHKNGLINGPQIAKTNIANTMVDEYINANSISKVSSVEMNAKKSWFRFVMDNNIREAIDSSLGYIKGVWQSFVSDIIPAALATGAILSKKNGITSKVCGVGLVLHGIKYLIYDIAGVGKHKYLSGKL